MSAAGTIHDVVEDVSELHLVNWPLFLAAVVFVVAGAGVVCTLNAFFMDPPRAEPPRTVYRPPKTE